jgi:hypothetical protein
MHNGKFKWRNEKVVEARPPGNHTASAGAAYKDSGCRGKPLRSQ